MVAIVGHRGAAGLEPENTVAAFDRALDLGVDAVEFDVRESADGHLVVIHDDTVDRTTDGTGPVAEHTIDELRALDAGDGQSIPTLAEALDHLAGADAELAVELKEPVGPAALAAVRERGLVDRTRFTSFEWASLRVIAGEEVRIGGPLGEADAASIDAAAERGYEYVGIHHEELTDELVERAHDHGMVVGAWTINDAGAIQRAVERDADSITSDRPDVALDVVG